MIQIKTSHKGNNNKNNYALLSNVYYNKDGFSKSTSIPGIISNKENTNTQCIEPTKIIIGTKKVKNSKKEEITENVQKPKKIKNKMTLHVSESSETKLARQAENKKDNKPVINVQSWVRMVNGRIKNRNFGDDINFSFLPNITDCEHLLYRQTKAAKNYLMIGSIFSDIFVDAKSEIWGSGMLNDTLLTKKPNKVYAVRGPKTREVALKSGIDCPEVYGDPALLLPYYYYPYVLKTHKIGIIPHHSNINDLSIKKFKDNKNIKFIDLVHYTDWKDVIKEILSCEFIVSESLHGLIIAEAYKIPNIWISINDIKQDFKYEDFFLSVGKKPYKPFNIKDYNYTYKLLALTKSYDPTFTLDIQKLIDASPVPLKHINLNNNIKPYTGKVLLCCIGKMENLYVREFVEYYKSIGFDNICLYDNNDEDGEYFEEVIDDYIESGFVILKDVRGLKLALIPAYTECYNMYKDQYDWIAFFDMDEFLNIDKGQNIKEFLSNDKYNDRGINCIRVCWKQYTDSGIIKTNGDYSVKKFKEFLPLNVKNASAQSKCIIKTLLDNILFTSPHGPLEDTRLICVNTNGDLCQNLIIMPNNTWNNARLNHYRFKTIEEFVLNKMIKLWPTNYLDGGKKGLNLNFYFRFNKKTDEKIKYANYLLDKYNISRNE